MDYPSVTGDDDWQVVKMSEINSASPLQTGVTNELAKERNRAAAERTLISWIQNCLALIGFGVAFDQIFVALQQDFPNGNQVITIQIAQIIGLTLIGLGIGLLIVAMVQYRIQVKSIEQDDYMSLPSLPLNTVVIAAVLLLGLISVAVIFLKVI